MSHFTFPYSFRTYNESKPLVLVAVLICLCLALTAGCRAKKNPQEDLRAPALQKSEQTENQGIPRPDAGYIQWLSKQSMLYQSASFTQVVSDKSLQWKHSILFPHQDALLNIADSWLTLNTASLLIPRNKPLFASLHNPTFWSQTSKLGFTGLLLTPLRDSGSIWTPSDSGINITAGDSISYNFSKFTGGKNQLATLTRRALQHKTLMGDMLIPVATGMGADFFLALRAEESHAGTYCLIELSPSLWKDLPQPERDEYVTALTKKQISHLHSLGILPQGLARSQSTIPYPSVNWGVTKKMQGVDGKTRRFAYLYYKTPDRPILHWPDPSAAARRMISASVIQETGLQGAALVGMQIGPLIGLSPAPPKKGASQAYSGGTTAADVAIEAAGSIAREVRRYGGWSFIQDPLPLPLLSNILRKGPDFAVDHAGSVSAQYALLTGDVSMLAITLKAMHALGINRKQLIHAIQPSAGMNLSLLHLYGISQAPFVTIRNKASAKLLERITQGNLENRVDKKTLYLTPAAITALAANIATDQKFTTKQAQHLQNGMSTLALFHAIQPGLFFASGRDITGTLPLPDGIVPAKTRQQALEQNVRGAYDLCDMAKHSLISPLSLPKAKNIFGSIAKQMAAPLSFANTLQRAVALRKQYQISRATALGLLPTRNKGTLLQLFGLPDTENILLVATNFAQSASIEVIPFRQKLLRQFQAKNTTILLSNISSATEKIHTGISKNKITLAPWETRIFLLQKSKVSKPKTS